MPLIHRCDIRFFCIFYLSWKKPRTVSSRCKDYIILPRINTFHALAPRHGFPTGISPMKTSTKSTHEVSHSNTAWLGYIQQLHAKYSIGGVNMGKQPPSHAFSEAEGTSPYGKIHEITPWKCHTQTAKLFSFLLNIVQLELRFDMGNN